MRANCNWTDTVLDVDVAHNKGVKINVYRAFGIDALNVGMVNNKNTH